MDHSRCGNGDDRPCQNVAPSVILPELRMEVARINEHAAGKQHENKSYAIVICSRLLSLRRIIKNIRKKVWLFSLRVSLIQLGGTKRSVTFQRTYRV